MTGIWHLCPDADELNRIHRETACEALGIEVTEVGDDFLRGTMPVDARTRQPFGLLHGGASLVLAETLGSAAANSVIDTEISLAVGSAMTANHLRSATEGIVTGTARPAHLGRSQQLWEIEIVDEAGRRVCLARLTTSVVAKERLKRKD